MDTRYSDSLQFNPHRYERSLSSFGKKVLDKLVKKWTSDRNRSLIQHSSYQSRALPTDPPLQSAYNWPRSKKVLTFLSEQSRTPQLPLPPITCIDILKKNIDEPIDFDEDIEKRLPNVQTTKELLKTVDEAHDSRKIDKASSTQKIYQNSNGKDELNISTYDMIDPVLDQNKPRNITDDFFNKPHDQVVLKNLDSVSNFDELESMIGPRINWDDMFDTELLPVDTDAKPMIRQNTNANPTDNTFAFLLGTSDKGQNYDGNTNSKSKETKQVNNKKTKRKTQAKATDTIPKKVKKVCEQTKSKNNFRKQKYTKTVKNWLDDVSSNNPVEEDKCKEEEVLNKSGQIIFEKDKARNNKKVVQAQLANKDGKMKFRKPKEIILTETKTQIDLEKCDKVKDTKQKPKFVPPIKSQLPVKEVNYKIVFVDNVTILEHTENLHLIVDKDLVIVLMYSNGYSQLNQQHTEDSCEPDGLIANIMEKFYYFKGFDQCFKEVIGHLLEKNRIICYEGKSILIYLKSKFGLEFNDLCAIDTKVGGSLLDPDKPPENFTDLQKLLSYEPQYTIATECSQQKAAWYSILLDECAVKLTTALKEDGLWHVFVDIEMKLLPIIAEMERRGMSVDLQKLKSMEDVLLTKMKEVEQECYKAAGRTFQLNSAVQIRAIIYEELQLDTKCNVKIKETICKGAKSTSETMLRSLVSVHPLPRLILEYRHLHKAHATFLTGIAQQVKDGIVRPTWVQTAAATGRIASNNPNLQAIPKAPFSLILFPDENNYSGPLLCFRSVYVSRKGWRLVAADFQHIECRVFAHCAADASLGHALLAGDIFRALAAKWLNKPETEISSEDRERTKRIVYASLYGAGCRKLMDILGVSYEQALSIVSSFNRTFPSLKSFGRSVVSRCVSAGGRLTSLCGRARHFPNISGADPRLRAQAERQAVNFVVQGSAADLCKLAMVQTSRRLRTHRPRLEGRLLLQIHDELVWEVREEHVHPAAAIIKQVMESCGQHCGMDVPLPVTVSVGCTWGDMEEYKPFTH